jgi:hypothetical protein
MTLIRKFGLFATLNRSQEVIMDHVSLGRTGKS